MLTRIRVPLNRFYGESSGAVAVEMAVLLPLFVLLVFAIIDFGQLYMMDHLITNASREGARYGVVYRVDANNNPIPPSSQTTQIVEVVNNYLTGLLPSGSWSVPTPTYDTATKKLTVRVNATKTWLGPLSLFLPNPLTISASTTMIWEG